MSSIVIWTIVVISVLGLILAAVLYLVAERFKVEEDPRIDEVEKTMPGANCGGCGYAGCHAFAVAAVQNGNLDKNYCPVGGNDVMKKVADILGYKVEEKAPMIAVVRCNGTCQFRPKVAEYDGYPSCKVKAATFSGDTLCAQGCLGCGDCVSACQFDAIHMNPETGLPEVDESKCVACGACVKACEGSSRDAYVRFLHEPGQGSGRQEGLCRSLHWLRYLRKDLPFRSHHGDEQHSLHRL